jgi:hypothetical protein
MARAKVLRKGSVLVLRIPYVMEQSRVVIYCIALDEYGIDLAILSLGYIMEFA